MSKQKCITVLDQRRSNNILIEIKKMPAARHIRAAILNMDTTFFTKEMVEVSTLTGFFNSLSLFLSLSHHCDFCPSQKLLLTLMPTDEEKTSIQEQRTARPDLPLGPAEDFLFTLASIPELNARLNLWRFNYHFQSLEEELGDSLMDLKMAIEEIQESKTFKRIVGCLLCIGNTLSGKQEKAFDLEYLTRVVDIKDTLHKTPLLVHIVELVVERFPDSSDLHSELSHTHRVAKV